MDQKQVDTGITKPSLSPASSRFAFVMIRLLPLLDTNSTSICLTIKFTLNSGAVLLDLATNRPFHHELANAPLMVYSQFTRDIL